MDKIKKFRLVDINTGQRSYTDIDPSEESVKTSIKYDVCVNMRDKNGAMIYDNDILEMPDHEQIYVIRLKEGMIVGLHDDGGRILSQNEASLSEISGTVYELKGDLRQRYINYMKNVHESEAEVCFINDSDITLLSVLDSKIIDKEDLEEIKKPM